MTTVVNSRPVVIDCDNTMGDGRSEIDDGLAILTLLSQPDVDLLGITTTFGNGPLSTVTRCTRRLIDGLLAGGGIRQREIAVVPGAVSAGGHATEAAEYLAHCARENSGKLTIVALGPLTNLHAAAAADPHFFSHVDSIICMGGYLAPVRFPRSEVAELNFSCDPAAAHLVLHAPCSVSLMSAQLCLQARYGFRHLLQSVADPPWLRRQIARWFAVFSARFGTAGFYLWDLVPVMYFLQPERFSGRVVKPASTVSDLSTGRLVALGPDGAEGAEGAEGTAVAGENAPSRVESAARRQPSRILLPERIVRHRRFAADCTALWRVVARTTHVEL